ncbi:MAG: peroxidase family protein [Natronosporangium sp.]
MEFASTTDGRVLSGTSHGGHVLVEEEPSAEAAQLAATQEGITVVDEPVSDAAFVDGTTPFGYLFTDLQAQFPDKHLPDDDPAAVVAALKALGSAMVEDPPPPEDPLQPVDNSIIPPIYTYWGQFLDHDLTANTDRDSAVSDITRPDLVPLHPDHVLENLRNLRQPAVNLDSVYGDGPTFPGQPPTQAGEFYDGIRFKVGSAATETNDGEPIAGARIPPEDDLRRDLPRVDRIAQIGDDRNDENLIVAQLHLAFLRFHNAVVDWVVANEPDHADDPAVFARARQLVRWHYQWLVVHDFLKTVTLPGVADQVLLGGNRHFAPRDRELFMPLEFAVATYRFGHSMVRAVYDFNRNFGRPGTNVLPNAGFDLLFLFTGQSPTPFGGSTNVLPFNWIIEWDRMVDKGDPFPDHFARRIDTRVAPPLRDLVNQGNDPDLPERIREILKRLATRNLLRGYLLAIPTGQSVAEALGVPALSAAELQEGNSPIVNDALAEGGFVERTPLWYYMLKEAEVRANGNSLGEVGSRVVCETVIGEIRFDPDSYLGQPGGWTPAQGVRLPNGDLIVTIKDLLRFATVLP